MEDRFAGGGDGGARDLRARDGTEAAATEECEAREAAPNHATTKNLTRTEDARRQWST